MARGGGGNAEVMLAGDRGSGDMALHLLKQAFAHTLPMLLVNLCASAGAAWTLWRHDCGWWDGWLGASLLVTLLRALLWYAFTRSLSGPALAPETRQRLEAANVLGLTLTASLWGGLLWLVGARMDVTLEYTLSIIISALAGGATGIVAPLKYTGRVYITLLLLPSALALMLCAHDFLLGPLAALFWVVMLYTHYSNHRVLVRGLTLQFRNKQLIEDLQQLNHTLESRVVSRTAALHDIAHHDALTGLLNRSGLSDWLQANWRGGSEDEAAVLFLDLDRFKQINDAMGHDSGDQVLRTLARRFAAILPVGGALCRWGGDEFLVLLAGGPAGRQQVTALGARLIAQAALPIQIGADSLSLGLSIGAAFYPEDAADAKEAIHAADLAVAEAKRLGRGGMVIYSESFAENQRRRFYLGHALHEALLKQGLYLVYQPIVQANDGKLVAFEALCRWRDAQLGEIPPDEFIRLAEETERIAALGAWVLETACHTASRWQGPMAGARIAVNVSICQLLNPAFPDEVKAILDKTGLASTRLSLEVTESLFGETHETTVLQVVTGLHQLGIGIHIDDFGTGYSSLSRLHRFPVTAIKIDRSFVAMLGQQGEVIIESALLIARRMGMAVIAEGVETAQQAAHLAQLGVDYLQGYLISRPQRIPAPVAFVPAPDATAYGVAAQDVQAVGIPAVGIPTVGIPTAGRSNVGIPEVDAPIALPDPTVDDSGHATA